MSQGNVIRLFGKLRARTWEGLLFQLAGLAALIWFLLRVIEKPSRAFYPCQRAALPVASAFVVSLVSGLTASALALRRIWGVAAVHRTSHRKSEMNPRHRG